MDSSRRRALALYLCSLAIGSAVGVAIAAYNIQQSGASYRKYCDSVHGSVAHKIRWESGPVLVTLCER